MVVSLDVSSVASMVEMTVEMKVGKMDLMAEKMAVVKDKMPAVVLDIKKAGLMVEMMVEKRVVKWVCKMDKETVGRKVV